MLNYHHSHQRQEQMEAAGGVKTASTTKSLPSNSNSTTISVTVPATTENNAMPLNVYSAPQHDNNYNNQQHHQLSPVLIGNSVTNTCSSLQHLHALANNNNSSSKNYILASSLPASALNKATLPSSTPSGLYHNQICTKLSPPAAASDSSATSLCTTKISPNLIAASTSTPTVQSATAFLFEKGSENVKRFSVNNLLELAGVQQDFQQQHNSQTNSHSTHHQNITNRLQMHHQLQQQQNQQLHTHSHLTHGNNLGKSVR